MDRIELVFFGEGYNPEDWDGIVTISPPDEKDGVAATARAVWRLTAMAKRVWLEGEIFFSRRGFFTHSFSFLISSNDNFFIIILF